MLVSRVCEYKYSDVDMKWKNEDVLVVKKWHMSDDKKESCSETNRYLDKKKLSKLSVFSHDS